MYHKENPDLIDAVIITLTLFHRYIFYEKEKFIAKFIVELSYTIISIRLNLSTPYLILFYVYIYVDNKY